jgi:hypothetical protein
LFSAWIHGVFAAFLGKMSHAYAKRPRISGTQRAIQSAQQYIRKMASTSKHTLESCRAAAAQCASLTHLKQTNPLVYRAALRKGWLDLLGHERRPPPPEEWTRERVAKVAMLYSTRKAMRESGHQGAIQVAKLKGWDDLLPPVMSSSPHENTGLSIWCTDDQSTYWVGPASRRQFGPRVRHGVTLMPVVHVQVPDAKAIAVFASSLGKPVAGELRAYTTDELTKIVGFALNQRAQ